MFGAHSRHCHRMYGLKSGMVWSVTKMWCGCYSDLWMTHSLAWLRVQGKHRRKEMNKNKWTRVRDKHPQHITCKIHDDFIKFTTRTRNALTIFATILTTISFVCFMFRQVPHICIVLWCTRNAMLNWSCMEKVDFGCKRVRERESETENDEMEINLESKMWRVIYDFRVIWICNRATE